MSGATVFYCENNDFECDVETCGLGYFSGRYHDQRNISKQNEDLKGILKAESLFDGRNELLARMGGNVVSQGNFADHILYFIENRIAAYKPFPFVLISIFFACVLVLLSTGWYLIGYVRSLYGFSNEGVYGTKEYSDSVFFTSQLLSVGGFTDTIDSHFFRFWYFLTLFLGLMIVAVLIGFVSDSVNRYMTHLQGKTWT